MRIWITWEVHRRSTTLSARVGAQLFEFDVNATSIFRYILCLVKTTVLLLQLRASLIFVQSPSIVLAAYAVTWGRIAKVKVVVDAHNAGICPFDGQSKWANRLVSYTVKWARLVLVSNVALVEHVEKMGGRAFVLPDPVPDLESSGMPRMNLRGSQNVLFVCTYSNDEPYWEVINAAKQLDDDIVIYISGDSKKRGIKILDDLPKNVVLTGFLPDSEYIRTVKSVDLVLALTTREYCLLCGSYEGIAAGRALVVSDTKALREFISRGALFTKNESENIALTIRQALDRKIDLQKAVLELKAEKINEWEERRLLLESTLAQSC